MYNFTFFLCVHKPTTQVPISPSKLPSPLHSSNHSISNLQHFYCILLALYIAAFFFHIWKNPSGSYHLTSLTKISPQVPPILPALAFQKYKLNYDSMGVQKRCSQNKLSQHGGKFELRSMKPCKLTRNFYYPPVRRMKIGLFCRIMDATIFT